MAGIEVAGLVLGAFPIVVAALESYRDAFAPLKSWWKFQRTFERVLYDNNLEKLLSPFVDSEVQIGILLSDPFGRSWRDPGLDEKLRGRLGPSFPFYKSIVGRMHDVLVELQKLLGLQHGQAVDLWKDRKPGRIEIEYEFRRLRTSFSKKKFYHVENLSKFNDQLTRLLQSNDELAPMRSRRQTGVSLSVLQELQDHAQSLHKVLENAWTCTCHSAHTTLLVLERRTGDKHYASRHWKINLPERDDSAKKADYMETKVVIEDDDSFNSANRQKLDIPNVALNAFSKFKDQVEQQMTHLNISTPPVGIIEASTGIGTSLKKSVTDTSGVTLGRPSLLSSQKSSKKVSFAGDSTAPDNAVALSASVSNDKLALSAPINDICSTLRSLGQNDTCLGFLQDLQQRRHIFYPLQKNTLDIETTLYSALKPASGHSSFRPMNRQDRFTIAIILATAVLQLNATPWLKEQWDKTNVFLQRSETRRSIIPKPLLCAKFHSGTSSTPSQRAMTTPGQLNAKKVLSNLGIMLLELCFGKTIEDHPLRSQFFGPNNKPNAFTDLSTAREWHADVLGELGDDMSDAIRRCLDCSFAPKPNLEDKEFQKAVFDDVVVPLQDLVKVWEKP